MEHPSQEEEMPIPLNSTYGGHGHGHAHMIHHDHASQNHIVPSSLSQIPSNGPISSTLLDEHVSFKKMIKYKECLKNHAASMGGNATDGCGEFMPNGEEGTLEALNCSACNCHRNFHRKEIEGEPYSCDNYCYHNVNQKIGKKVFMGQHKGYLGQEAIGYHAGTLIPSRAVAPHQMIMSYNVGSDQSDEQDEGNDNGGVGGVVMVKPPQLVKKRFRTKFTLEQKEKLFSFAEKVGWKIQKQEEAVVQQFCQEIGIKRRVLKVWMHNNKHSLVKKNHQSKPEQNEV